MRLLILTQAVDRNDSNLGFFHGWIEVFAARCEKVTVICLREGEHTLPKNVEILSLGKERNTSRITRTLLFFRYIISRRREYEGVFVHMNPEYIVLGGWLWRLWGKRIVLWYVHKSVTWKLRIAEIFVTTIATASKESFRLKTKKLHIVGHGIDTKLFSPHTHTPPGAILRIATAGRFSRSKKLKEMLLVLDVLYARGRTFHFSVAGIPLTREDGDYAREFAAAVAARPYATDVEMWGALPHHMMPEFLSTQDVFLNFSATGSVDKLVLEALAAGVMVVTSNDAFKDKVLPVEYRPLEATALADAVETSIRSPRAPQVLASAVERLHGINQCISRILALYGK